MMNILNWFFVISVLGGLVYFGIRGKKYMDALPDDDNDRPY
jgi:hypothetical protein